jgi:hypothetical protein
MGNSKIVIFMFLCKTIRFTYSSNSKIIIFHNTSVNVFVLNFSTVHIKLNFHKDSQKDFNKVFVLLFVIKFKKSSRLNLT